MSLVYDGKKVSLIGQLDTTPLQVNVPNNFSVSVPVCVPKHKAESLASLVSLVTKGKAAWHEVESLADTLGVDYCTAHNGVFTFVKQPLLKRWVNALKRRLCDA